METRRWIRIRNESREQYCSADFCYRHGFLICQPLRPLLGDVREDRRGRGGSVWSFTWSSSTTIAPAASCNRALTCAAPRPLPRPLPAPPPRLGGAGARASPPVVESSASLEVVCFPFFRAPPLCGVTFSASSIIALRACGSCSFSLRLPARAGAAPAASSICQDGSGRSMLFSAALASTWLRRWMGARPSFRCGDCSYWTS